MKALSVNQPFAHAIIHGSKRIENRTWLTEYRGPLLIHASKEKAWFKAEAKRLGLDPATVIHGALIGVVDLLDVLPLAKVRRDEWAEGPWCWVVQNPRAIQPVKWRGARGLFTVRRGLEQFTLLRDF